MTLLVGWHDHPGMPGVTRYWDGDVWTAWTWPSLVPPASLAEGDA